ncbi:MAG: tetratricopeptide repeat protein [Chlamydiota bacterium]|nr:tetratricopeptide repeat protein [Chlamydiota bacterium]
MRKLGFSLVLLIIGVLGLQTAYSDSLKEKMEAIEKRIENNPNDKNLYLDLGQYYFEAGDYSKAMQQFWEIYRLDPDHPDIHQWLGICFIKRGFIDKGSEQFRLSDGQTDTPMGYWGKAEFALARGDLNTTKEYLQKAIDIGIKMPSVYIQLARIDLEKKEFRHALLTLEKGIEYSTEKVIGCILKGDILFRKGDYIESLKAYQECLNMKPDFSELDEKIAAAFEKLGEYENSIKYYKKFLQTNPNDQNAILETGLLQLRINAFEDALNSFQKVVDMNPTNARAHTFLGIAQQSLGDYDHAFQSYNRAVDLDPENPELYFYLGNAYFEKEEYLGAIVSYERTMHIDPNYTRVYRKMALSYHLLGNEGDALKYLKKACIIPMQDNLITKSFGIYYQNRVELKKAFKWLNTAVEKNPETAEYFYHLGEVMFKLGFFEAAIERLEKGLKDTREFAYVHRLLGQMYEYTNPDKAVGHYHQYLIYYPAGEDSDFISGKIAELKKD